MGHNFTCPHCGKISPHYARHSCKTCYEKIFMAAYQKHYIIEYRRRDEYTEQRKDYDITYQLKNILPTK